MGLGGCSGFGKKFEIVVYGNGDLRERGKGWVGIILTLQLNSNQVNNM